MTDADDGLTPVPDPRYPLKGEPAEGFSVEGVLGEAGLEAPGLAGLALLGVAGALWVVRRAVRRLGP